MGRDVGLAGPDHRTSPGPCRPAPAGTSITVLYLTRGEAGIPGKSHPEAADIRTAEAHKACATTVKAE
jgi:hypothetical protein